MAKRKRLTPLPVDPGPGAPAPSGAASTRAPIAQVAGDAAATAALHDVSQAMERARDEGRMLLSLPLEEVRADHLVRDRMVSDDAEMTALCESLRARGQQAPIEVTPLPGGGYGLISGWRRLTALRRLAAETGAPRFDTVQAILRHPESGAAAYVAMVEENEIRADLSFYERAHIVRRAVDQGVFETDHDATATLFAAAPAARRSKIKSFLRVVDELGDVLRHPTRIAEHLGLKLSAALARDPALSARIARALGGIDPADPEAEIAALKSCLVPVKPGGKNGSNAGKSGSDTAEIVISEGLVMRRQGRKITLEGTRVTADFADRLRDLLRRRG